MQIEQRPVLHAGGLVTVAYLKAQLDEGNDHLSIFMPLVLDAIRNLPSQSFTTAEVQEALSAAHGVAMPQDPLATLLRRAIKKGFIVRDIGRFMKSPSKPLPDSNVSEKKAKILEMQDLLGGALQAHAAKRELVLDSAEQALDLLCSFLERQQVSVLLGDTLPNGEGSGTEHRHDAIVAEFIQEAIDGGTPLAEGLRGVLEGTVLYHAAFLPNLNERQRPFRDLRVFFDSSLVRQALGYEGPAMQALMRDTLDLLKKSGIHCMVFDKTVHEIKRILTMYEDKLATPQGRSSLRHVAMARHFLTQRYTPSDVREMSALLEREVKAVGFYVAQVPPRRKEFTHAEEALGKILADPKTKDETEPRVTHDVDCVAGVLILREGHRSAALEEIRVVFASSSPLVIQNTRRWWEEVEHETGIAPIIHIRALASVAWLKKPALCTDFKMHELAALCSAALHPSTDTWRKFLKHLETLREKNQISSDEEASIVISSMSDRLLSEAEMVDGDEDDIDASTLDEIVDRVKDSYGAHAEERVRQVREEYEHKLQTASAETDAVRLRAEQAEQGAAEKERRDDLRQEGRARRIARILTITLQWLSDGLLSVGAVALICGHPFHGGTLGILVGVTILVFVAAELMGLVRHVGKWRTRVEISMTACFRRWLKGSE